MTDEPDTYACDVLVVGGGINGVGVARDLAGRGWRVALVEQDDLGAHTSSASSKLIHGGLRYLEYYEFGLVRKSLLEREILMRSAPHIIRPLRLVMPHDPSMRPAWMIRIGLFLYDHLARREVLPGSEGVDLRGTPLGAPLQPRFTRGFAYSDGCADDARLVLLTALDAQDRGAQIHTRTRCVAAQRSEPGWTATLETADGRRRTLSARLLVNAAGPWAEAFLRGATVAAHGEALATRSLRLVKGSHIVVPRCFTHDHAYLFQNPDKRIIFAIPFESDFTLIGTTDVEVRDPADAHIADDEVAYLCEQASRYFVRPVTPADVVWSYSGVRPLLDDDSGSVSAISRDYLLEANTDAAPLLTVWGGKLTTYRKLAEEAADRIDGLLGGAPRPHWTAQAPLPGGDLAQWIGPPRRPDIDFERFVAAVQDRYGWLDAGLARRLARAHGSRIERVLGPARSLADLGGEIAPGLFEAELDYLRREEWASTADDVLWRRTKLGLRCDAAAAARVAAWMERAGGG
jgi:glycerol-3-phosphate dehydrogenase